MSSNSCATRNENKFCLYQFCNLSSNVRNARPWSFNFIFNKPFPSCFSPLFQNKFWCKTFKMEMSLVFPTMHVQEKLIPTWKVVFRYSLWNRGKSNSKTAYYDGLWLPCFASRKDKAFNSKMWKKTIHKTSKSNSGISNTCSSLVIAYEKPLDKEDHGQ